MATLDCKVVPFPVRSRTPQSGDSNTKLLKAARAAYSALLLAVPHGEKNVIVRNLGDAIRAFDSQPPVPPTVTQRKPPAAVKLTGAVADRAHLSVLATGATADGAPHRSAFL